MKFNSKRFYAEINGEVKDYSKYQKAAIMISLVNVLIITSILGDKFFNHKLGVSPMSKLLQDVKLSKDELSIGSKLQIDGLKNEIDNADIYYYDYIKIKDEYKLNINELNNFKEKNGYKIDIREKYYLQDDMGQILFPNRIYMNNRSYLQIPNDYEIKSYNEYYAVKEQKLNDVYVVNYNNSNYEDLYIIDNKRYYNINDTLKIYDKNNNCDEKNYVVLDKGIKRVLKK